MQVNKFCLTETHLLTGTRSRFELLRYGFMDRGIDQLKYTLGQRRRFRNLDSVSLQKRYKTVIGIFMRENQESKELSLGLYVISI